MDEQILDIRCRKIHKLIYRYQGIIWFLGVIWSLLCAVLFSSKGPIGYCFFVCLATYALLFSTFIFGEALRTFILGLIFVSIIAMIPPVFILESTPRIPVDYLLLYLFGFIFFLFFDLCIYIRTLKPKD